MLTRRAFSQGFCKEIARAAAHGFDGDFYAAPGGHDHDGKSTVEFLDSREQIQSFLAGGGISRIVQVHQYGIEFARFNCGESLGGGGAACVS